MKAIDSLQEKVRHLGATVTSDQSTVYIDSPPGYVWSTTGCRALVIVYNNGSQTWLAKAIADAMPDVRMGLVKVTDPKEIERHQWELGDDDWKAPDGSPEELK